MTQNESFAGIWEAQPFTCQIAEPDDGRGPCEAAVAFQAWIDDNIEAKLGAPNHIKVYRMKLALQDHYFECFAAAPKRHRFLGNSGRGHRCLFAVYMDEYRRLRQLELDLAPPPLLAPPRPKRKLTQLDGLVLGEPDPEFG